MSDNSFEIGGRKFKLSKIDPFKQFHVVRRIGPIMSDLLPAIQEAHKNRKNIDALSESEKFDLMIPFAGSVMSGLSKLTDADSEYVMFSLLSSVEVQQPAGNWGRVSTNSMLMMQDLELPMLLQIASRAFAFNLSSFFTVLPQK